MAAGGWTIKRADGRRWRAHALVAAVGLALALAGLKGAFAAGSAVTLQLYDFLPPTSIVHSLVVQRWARHVEKDSHGRIKIELHPNTSVADPSQLIRRIRDGKADMVWTALSTVPGEFPRSEVFELPFIHTNQPVATNLAIRDMFKRYLAPDYPDLKVILLHVGAGNAFQLIDHPIRTARGFRGEKLAVLTRTGAWTLEALGAKPVQVSLADLPQALSDKAVNGALVPFGGVPTLPWHKLAKYQIEGDHHIRFGTSVFLLAMNKKKYAALPADLKAVIDKDSGHNLAVSAGWMLVRADQYGLRVARDKGNRYFKISPFELEKFKAKLEAVVDRWIADVKHKGIDGQALVKAARAAIAKHSADE